MENRYHHDHHHHQQQQQQQHMLAPLPAAAWLCAPLLQHSSPRVQPCWLLLLLALQPYVA
jgi:hypothetical protein